MDCGDSLKLCLDREKKKDVPQSVRYVFLVFDQLLV